MGMCCASVPRVRTPGLRWRAGAAAWQYRCMLDHTCVRAAMCLVPWPRVHTRAHSTSFTPWLARFCKRRIPLGERAHERLLRDKYPRWWVGPWVGRRPAVVVRALGPEGNVLACAVRAGDCMPSHQYDIPCTRMRAFTLFPVCFLETACFRLPGAPLAHTRRWLQSYLAGVPTLVLGGRDRGGVITEVSRGWVEVCRP